MRLTERGRALQIRDRPGNPQEPVEPDGIAALKKLIATADVVVENFRPDVKFRLGIDHETLSRDHPRPRRLSPPGGSTCTTHPVPAKRIPSP